MAYSDSALADGGDDSLNEPRPGTPSFTNGMPCPLFRGRRGMKFDPDRFLLGLVAGLLIAFLILTGLAALGY